MRKEFEIFWLEQIFEQGTKAQNWFRLARYNCQLEKIVRKQFSKNVVEQNRIVVHVAYGRDCSKRIEILDQEFVFQIF